VTAEIGRHVRIVAVNPAQHPEALICNTCGKAWAEDITPAGRCPWESDHDDNSWPDAAPTGNLPEAVNDLLIELATGDALTAPATVLAIAGVLTAAGYPNSAQALIESEQDQNAEVESLESALRNILQAENAGMGDNAGYRQISVAAIERIQRNVEAVKRAAERAAEVLR
jgi:hypothetical protein